MLVKIQGPNLRDQSKGSFHVHSAECGDNAKYEDDQYEKPIEVDCQLACEDAVYGPDAGSFYQESPGHKPGDWLYDFHFMPCCKGLPYGEPADYDYQESE